MKPIEIIEYVSELKMKFNMTNDPIELCSQLNIPVRSISLNPNIYKAYTTNIFDKTIISINSSFDDKSKKILCAHELGHALLHHDKLFNQFDGDNYIQEYEANLFAVALLLNESQQSSLIAPLHKLSNSELKCILDSNLNLKTT